jgi:hypothetical protein
VNSGDAEKALGRITQSNAKLNDSVKKNQTELDKMTKKLDEFKGDKRSAEYKKLQTSIEAKSSAIQKDTERMRVNSDEMSRIDKKIKGELSPSYNDLTAKVVKLTRELKGMSKEMDGYTDKVAELKQVRAELEKHDITAKKIENSYASMAQGSGDFMGRMEMLRSGNFAEAFDGIGESFKGMFASMKAFLLSPIGAAIGLITALALATKEWLSYNNEIAKQNALIEQLTGYTGKMTDTYREMGTAIEDVFNKDFKESILELDNLVKDFNISQEEAFAIYTDGMVRGGAANNEFGESIREYGQLFANNGYSAQEFINILNAGIDLQIYNDKLPDAIKEAGLALTEQTKATKDAMVNAFGAQFTEEILSKVKSGEITVAQALTNISSKSKEANLNQQQLAQLTADLFKGAGEDAGGALGIFNALNKSVNISKEELTKYQEALIKAVSKSRELEKAQTDALSSNMVMSIKQNFETQWKEAQIYFYKLISEIRGIGNYIGAFWESQSFAVKNIPKVWLGAFQDIKVYFSNLIKFLNSGKDIIKDILTGNFSGAKAGLSNLSNFDISKGVGNYTKALEDSRIKQKQVFDEYMQQKDIQMQAEAALFRSKQEKETVIEKPSVTPTGKLRQSQAAKFKANNPIGPSQGAESTFLLGNHLTTEQLNEKIAEYNVFLNGLNKRKEDFNLVQKQNIAKNTLDINDDYAAQIDGIELKYNREIEAAGNNAELIKQIEAEKNEALLQAQIEHDKKIKKQDEDTTRSKLDKITGYIAAAGQLLQGLSQIFSNNYQADLNREVKSNEDKKRKYKQMLDSKQISQKKYDELVLKADEETAKKQSGIKKKQFEAERNAKYLEIGIQTAVAVAKAIATSPQTFGLPWSAFAAAQGALQAGIVASTPTPEFRRGGIYQPGILQGPSHENGGLGLYNEQTGQKVAEYEGGEAHMLLSKEFTKNNADIIPSILAASRSGASLSDTILRPGIPSLSTSRVVDSIRFREGGILAKDMRTSVASTTAAQDNSTAAKQSISPDSENIRIIAEAITAILSLMPKDGIAFDYNEFAKKLAIWWVESKRQI